MKRILTLLLAVSMLTGCWISASGSPNPQRAAADYNTLVIPLDTEENFEFCGTGTWRENTGWTSGVSQQDGIWMESASSDGSNAQAVYVTEKLSENWYTSMTFQPISNENGGRTVCRTTFLDADRNPVMLVSIEFLTDSKQVKFSWQVADNDGWHDLLSAGDWVSVEDDVFTVTLEKKSETDISLAITGSSYQLSAEQTLDRAVMASISRVGVATERSCVRITHFTVDAKTQQRDLTALAQQTYQNLLTNYLDTENNRIYPVRWGFRNGDLTNTGKTVQISDAGEVWESTVMLMALDTYAQTLDKHSEEWEAIAHIIANTVDMFLSGYSRKQLTTAAAAPNYAMDDCGWNVMCLLLGYYYNKELGNPQTAVVCYNYAKDLFNSTYETFYSTQMGGLSYTTKQEDVSLYGATMALAGYYLNQIQPDAQVQQRYTDIYNGIEQVLRRPDGLYWCHVDGKGADGTNRPYDINEAGSVSYIGGNMAMAVLNSLLGHTDKVEQTVLGILRYETYQNGAFMNDRDAWNNTFFLGMFVREVIQKDIVGDIAQRALNATVSLVLQNACFDDGYYSASWRGPREPSSLGYPSEGNYTTEGRNNWGKGYNNDGLNIGSTPNQIMTSATTAHVFFAAALSTTGSNYQETLHTIDNLEMPPETNAFLKYVLPVLLAIGIVAGGIAAGYLIKIRRTPRG